MSLTFKKPTILFFITLILLGCSESNKESKDAPSIETFRSFLEVLASDDFEGRAPGTPGGIKTKEFIAEEFSKLNLEKFNGSYQMPVKLTEITLDVEKSNFSISLEGKGLNLRNAKDYVYWTKRQIEEVSFKDSELVFVGYGINAPEYEWLDYDSIDVRGKTLVMLINDPGFELQDPSLFKGKAMTYYGRWTYKFEEAARRGAEAVLIIHETAPAAYGWQVVETSNVGPQLDLYFEDKNLNRVSLEGWITKDTAEKLFSTIGKSYQEMKEFALSKNFRPVNLTGLSLSTDIKNEIRFADSHNVVGFIKGQERAEEYLMVMAHWDHLGINSVGEIYNGAADNATGTAMVMALAEYLSQEDFKRSIIFATVTAEESGLLGSGYLANNLPFKENQMVAGLNLDAYFAFGRAKDLQVLGYGASELEDLMLESAKKKDKYLSPDFQPEKGLFYRSDHVNFAKKGIPVLYIDPGVDMLEGGIERGKELINSYYIGGCYHQVCDEITKEWKYDGIEEDLWIFADFLKSLANSVEYPNWYEGNEFKSIRDQSINK